MNVTANQPANVVHPRVCGERGDPTLYDPTTTGSSPRVRGTPHPRDGSFDIGRFIPACAGNAALRMGRGIA